MTLTCVKDDRLQCYKRHKIFDTNKRNEINTNDDAQSVLSFITQVVNKKISSERMSFPKT